MSALAKVFVVFVFILSVAFFGTSATLFTIRMDWKKAYEDVKENYEHPQRGVMTKLKTAFDDLRAELDAKNNTISTLTVAQDTLGREVAQVKSDLLVERGKVEQAHLEVDNATTAQRELATTVQSVTASRDNLEQQLAAAKAEAQAAKDDARQARSERDDIAVDLNRMQIEIHGLKKQLMDLQEQSNTDKILLTAYIQKFGTMEAGTVPIDARVSAVDNEEGLVVLSVGEQDQVKIGDLFTVYRGDTFVGKVKVIKLFPNLSGARIEYTKDAQVIRSGDAATTKIN